MTTPIKEEDVDKSEQLKLDTLARCAVLIRYIAGAGAVDLDACTTRRKTICHCQKCAVCGWGKHMAIHGPLYGQPPGSKPWGHEFKPKVGV